MIAALLSSRPNQRGQGIVEYGLILSLMTAVAALILFFLGGTLAEVLSVIGEAIDSATS